MPIHTETLPTALPVRSARAALLVAGLLVACAASQTAIAAPGDIGKATVDGALDKPAIREVVATHIDEVRHCYNAELVEDDTVAGHSVVAFVVGPEGSVSEVGITASTMPESFDACLIAAVQTWSFPTSEGQTRVTYPLLMSAG